MNRRGFIKSFATLAALAVVPTTLIPLEKTDREKLVGEMKTGQIVGKTFWLDGPIVLDIDGLHLIGCKFIFIAKEPMKAAVTIKASNMLIDRCHFDLRGCEAEVGLYFIDKDHYGA